MHNMCFAVSYNIPGGELVSRGGELVSSDDEQYVLDAEPQYTKWQASKEW